MTGLRSEEPREVDARLLHRLYELSSSVGRILDPGDLIKLVAEHACDLLQGDAVAVFLLDSATGLMQPVFSNDPRDPREEHVLQPGEGAAGLAIRRRAPVVVEDYRTWELAIPWAAKLGLTTVAAVPLLVGDRPIGALVVRFYREGVVLGDQDRQVMTLLAAQVAPALEAARLYATSTRDRQHERALREITQAMAVNLDERQVLTLAVR